MTTDPFTPAERSAVMRAVKSTNTTPELKVRAMLRALGVRYRLGGFGLPGKPDLVFPGRRAAIFVHGCFWHGHTCPRGARAPKTNAAYWEAKILRTSLRDLANSVRLDTAGWRVLVVWECEIADAEALKTRLAAFLTGDDASA